MIKNMICSIVLLLLTAFAASAQSQSLYIGDVELRLGMSRDAAMKLITSKYSVEAVGDVGFMVKQYDPKTKRYSWPGSFVIEGDKVIEITRDLDTSAWPNDEGFAVGRAIYDAIAGSIPLTDSDGAKRATFSVVVSSRDANKGNLKSISMYVNNRTVSVAIWDGTDGKSVSASIRIRSKPL